MMKRNFVLFFIALWVAGCASFQLKSSLFRAQNLIKSGGIEDLKRAEQILLRNEISYPDNPEIHTYLGIVYYYQNRWDEAKDELENAINLGSKSYLPHYYLGLIYYRTGDYDSARTELEKAYTQAEEEKLCIPEIFKIIGSIFEIMERYPAAIAFYKKALTCKQKGKSEIEIRTFKAEIYERLALISEKLSKIAWSRGNYDSSDNQASMAENYYLKAINLSPDEAVYYLNLARLYWWLGRISDATNYFRLAALKASKSGEVSVQKEAFFDLGYLYESIGKSTNSSSTLKLALYMYSNVEAIDPAYKHVRCKIGELYWYMGNNDEAYKKLSMCCRGGSQDIYGFEMERETSSICKNLYAKLKSQVAMKISSPKIESITPQTPPPEPEITTEKMEKGEVEASISVEEKKPETVNLPGKEKVSTEKNLSKEEASAEKTGNKSLPPGEGSKKELASNRKVMVNQKKTVSTGELSTPEKTKKVAIISQSLPVEGKTPERIPASKNEVIKKSAPGTPEKESSSRSEKRKTISSNIRKTRKKSFFGTSIGGGINLGDIDKLLSEQNSQVKKQEIIIAGVRRRGKVRNVDIDINVGEVKKVSLKKNIKKIEAQIKLSSEQKSGRLDPKVISTVIASHYGEVRYCYEKQLKINPNLEGKIEVKFTIGSDGHVSAASIEESTLNNMEVESCILFKVKNWTFPRPMGGSVTVIFPFIFMGGG